MNKDKKIKRQEDGKIKNMKSPYLKYFNRNI